MIVRKGARFPGGAAGASLPGMGKAEGATLLRRRVGPEEAGLRLADALALWLPATAGHPVPMARVRALVAAGAARVDGEVQRSAGRPLRRGQRVVAFVRPELLQARARPAAQQIQVAAEGGSQLSRFLAGRGTLTLAVYIGGKSDVPHLRQLARPLAGGAPESPGTSPAGARNGSSAPGTRRAIPPGVRGP